MGSRQNPYPFPTPTARSQTPALTGVTLGQQIRDAIRRNATNTAISDNELISIVQRTLLSAASDSGLDIADILPSEASSSDGPGPSRRQRMSNSRSPTLRTVRNTPGGSNTQARALRRLQRTSINNEITNAAPRDRPSSSRIRDAERPESARSNRVQRLSSERRGRSQDSSIGTLNTALGQTNGRQITSNSSRINIVDGSRRRRIRVRPRSLSFDLSKVLLLSAQNQVMSTEKFLIKIFSHLTWNDLIRKRRVCRKWQATILNDSSLQSEMSKVVVSMKQNFPDGFRVFNNSKNAWTKFRIDANVVFDLTQPVQSDFWSKHGPVMSFLEIRNSSMTIATLVEILMRTTNLESLVLTWTPEMYSFNADMIKRYYGVTFRNSTFQKMENLQIEHCSSLTDNALWSILRWCGSSLTTIALTNNSFGNQGYLGRFKPRWTMQPIDDFATRFGYSGNLKFLDFSGSNLVQVDLTKLAWIEKLTHLTGLRLTSCNISDDGLLEFLERKGHKLEELHIDYTKISENVFQVKSNTNLKLPKLRILNISETKNFSTLSFLQNIPSLKEFYCNNTSWLNKQIITEAIQPICTWKKLDIGFKEMSDLKIKDSDLKNVWFNQFATAQSKLSEVHFNFWGIGNDANFKLICMNMLNLKKLSVRGWKISDEGITGMSGEVIADYDLRSTYAKLSKKKKVPNSLIGNLKRLEVLDIGRCENLTDSAINYGLIQLANLRAISLDYTQITDTGLEFLISNLKSLAKINADGCERVGIPKDKKIQRPDETVVFFGVVL